MRRSCTAWAHGLARGMGSWRVDGMCLGASGWRPAIGYELPVANGKFLDA